jgi:hypothetical protein
MEGLVTSQEIMAQEAIRKIDLQKELDTRLDGVFWKSPDISVAKKIIVEPGPAQLVPVNLSSDISPSKKQPDFLTIANWSVRSRYAQIGLDIPYPPGEFISKSIKSGQKNSYILIDNFGPRPIKLHQGDPIFRFFAFPTLEKSLLRQGKDLYHLIEKGGISFTGEPGKDWQYFNDNFGKPIGIEFFLNPNHRKTVRPSSINEPITISSKDKDYRNFIDFKYLMSAPESTDLNFWVGETTSDIRLGYKVNAVIWKKPFKNGTESNQSIHLNSTLIDNGFNGHIKTEIVGSVNNKDQQSIFVQFFKDIK